MNDVTLSLLKVGLSNDGELWNNPLAHQLYEWIRNKQTNPNRDELIGLDGNSLLRIPKDVIEAAHPNREHKDMRLRKLELSEVRRFSSDGGKKQYRLGFDYKNSPLSCVFLGANGIGKSTLFNCIEWSMFGKLDSLRQSGVSTMTNYMSNVDTMQFGNTSIQDVSDTVYTPITPMGVPSCFACSQVDLYELQRKDNITEYVYRQLGIWEAYSLITTLEQTIEIVKESKKRFQESLGSKNATSKTNRKLTSKRKVNTRWGKESVRYIDIFKTDSSSKDSWIEYAESLHSFLSKSLQARMRIHFRSLIVPIFEKLFSNFQDSHDIVLRLDGLNVTAGIDLEGNIVPPHQYLNTFRMMLFCFALKISLTCCAKQIYKINAPVIVDDIFCSGDFDGRLKLVSFIRDMAHLHKDFCNDELQLIFFTQDSLTGDGVYQGLNEFSWDSGLKLSRIVDYISADPVPDEEKNTTENSMVVLNLEEVIDNVLPKAKK